MIVWEEAHFGESALPSSSLAYEAITIFELSDCFGVNTVSSKTRSVSLLNICMRFRVVWVSTSAYSPRLASVCPHCCVN